MDRIRNGIHASALQLPQGQDSGWREAYLVFDAIKSFKSTVCFSPWKSNYFSSSLDRKISPSDFPFNPSKLTCLGWEMITAYSNPNSSLEINGLEWPSTMKYIWYSEDACRGITESKEINYPLPYQSALTFDWFLPKVALSKSFSWRTGVQNPIWKGKGNENDP